MDDNNPSGHQGTAGVPPKPQKGQEKRNSSGRAANHATGIKSRQNSGINSTSQQPASRQAIKMAGAPGSAKNIKSTKKQRSSNILDKSPLKESQ